MKTKNMAGQVSMFAHDLPYGRTCLDASPAEETPKPERKCRARTSSRSSKRSSRLRNQSFMLLDLREGAGNILGPYWEIDPPWLGCGGTLNTSECPKDVVESSLSAILQADVPSRYYLSKAACLGILRRAWQRGKELPSQLKAALQAQAGIIPWPVQSHESDAGGSDAAGQRQRHASSDEDCLTPWDTQRARIFTPESKAPTLTGADSGGGRNPAGLLFAAGFCGGAGASAGSIGYQKETAPTLKGSAGGNLTPTVLCLSDQGGSVMDCSEEVSGTLRAQEHGHQPLVFELYENHGIDARYTGPLDVSPTLPARAGTGGNNLPLLSFSCPQFYSRQRTDVFRADHTASTESARQRKDATDLVIEGSETSDDESAFTAPRLIRKLTPLECERLQGFPDGWTDLPDASDSARYRALGNSVAIPCVEFIMQGIARAAGFIPDSTSIQSRDHSQCLPPAEKNR